jgi:hypothetical protein
MGSMLLRLGKNVGRSREACDGPTPLTVDLLGQDEQPPKKANGLAYHLAKAPVAARTGS